MINQLAVKAFLGRKLAEFDWIKPLPVAQLDLDISQLDPVPDFGGVKLWQHQKACFLLLLELKRFMLLMDMGGGKTLTTLMLLKYRKQCGEKAKAIVFVPYITSVETWVEEVKKHAPDLKCVAALGTKAQVLESLAQEVDLCVVCYQSAVSALSESGTVRNGKTRWYLRRDYADLFSSFDTFVGDELHKCKSIHSLTYEMCRGIAGQCSYCLGLTGTPFGRDLQDLWAQFQIIDGGKTLGRTLGIYRAAFFTESINYWGGYEYKFKQAMMPDLKRVIKNASISYTVDEFADMPSKEYIVRHLPRPEDSKGYCERSIADLKSAVKAQNYEAAQLSYLQLRQLSSSFMTLRGEDSNKLHVEFNQNPKLEQVTELLEGMPHGCKAVVFHHFVYSSEVISKKLKELKIKHARIWGGQTDPIGELRKFKDDPDCRVLVLNWKSGSSSLNLQGANYMIVYEQPDSPIDRKQGEARLWRPGQSRRVFIYDLLVRGTVDDRLYAANNAGRDLLRDLLSGAVS